MAVERSQKEVWRLTPWLLLVLLLINFGFMAYDARTESDQRVVRVWMQATANFVQSPVTSASSAISDYFTRVATMRTAQSENDKLRQRIHELDVQVQESQSLKSENERLQRLLELKDTLPYKVLTAKVVGRDTSEWFNSAVINRGSLDGVKLNMPVVVDGGLVGRVTAVSPLTAQIDLITSEKAGLGAIVGELGASNALGVMKGAGKNILEMNFVPGYVPINVGDTVYTSGQGGVYPAGLTVGQVSEVRTGSATVPHQIFIKPKARIYSMQEVAVLLYSSPADAKYDDALPNAVKEDKMTDELKTKLIPED